MKVWIDRDEWYPVYFIDETNALQIFVKETEIDEKLKERIRLAEKEFLACQEIMERIYNESKKKKASEDTDSIINLLK